MLLFMSTNVPIKHAVWPTKAPPVCTGFWKQRDWNTWSEGFRPEGYTGGMFDEVAWNEFRAAENLKYIRGEYAKYGIDYQE